MTTTNEQPTSELLPDSPPMDLATGYEKALADAATTIRGKETRLTSDLFLELWSLLARPIHGAHIQTIPATKGKPYVSTGIRSVQVQIDRMNSVLTPFWWRDEVEYHENGKLARVTVGVGNRGEEPLLTRTSWGGVGHGSNLGNLYKGSYTNAAKLAFARIGPGHEVYIGNADLDPDVSPGLAGVQDEKENIGEEIAEKLVAHAWEAGEEDRLRLAASRLAKADIGDCSTEVEAVKSLTGSLTFEQAEELDRWLLERSERKAGKE